MNPIIIDVEQGSPEWLEARMGLVTASRFKDVVTKTKAGAYTKKRDDYKAELVAERFGVNVDRFQSKEMLWGSETEGLARLEYTLKTGNLVDEVGMYKHPNLQVAVSPDGTVNTDGGIEIKNRKLSNHLYSLKTGEVPEDFIDQIVGCLWITGRKWWDYVSFAPEFPENAQLFIKRVHRDEEQIRNLEAEIIKFEREVAEEVEFVRGYKG